MLKRSIALAGVVALLGGVNPSAAQAQSRTATSIGAVQLTWADTAHSNIKITWSEDAPAANTLALVNDGGTPIPFGTTTAAEPNQFIIDSGSFGNTDNPALKSWIVVSDSATPAVQARSADFDRYLYRPASVTVTGFTADNQLRWTVPADTKTDGTPNDSLDLATNENRYLPVRRYDPDPATPSAECAAQDLAASTGASGQVPPLGRPYVLTLNPENEWGARPGPTVNVTTVANLTITAPAVTTYNTTTTLTGQVNRRSVAIGVSTCDEVIVPGKNESVIVHQRTSSTGAWSAVKVVQSDATGKYSAALTNPGYRDYRVIQSTVGGAGFAAYGGVPSVTKAVRARTRVMSAKFITPTITYGTQPQAYLWVEPTGNQRAALQFLNNTTWTGMGYKTLASGKGILAFPFNRRGTYQFRWWVPAYGGADAVYTGQFALTVK